MSNLPEAPEWDCSTWLNSKAPLSLRALRGRPIVAAAFQMLCPGCVVHTIPQLNKVRDLFDEKQVAVLGLHSVFEHHAAMGETSLRAFLHEYGVTFPVGIDRHVDGQDVPVTMRHYGLRGTPTVLLIDAAGRLRRQVFGHIPDLQLGAEIMAMIDDARSVTRIGSDAVAEGARCEVGAGSC